MISMRQRGKAAPVAAAVVLSVLPLSAALAADNPYYAGAGLRVTHHSNIAASPVAADTRADVVTTASVFAGLDQPIGRQRLRANVSLDQSEFSKTRIYNNLGYRANASWDFETIEKISGTARVYAGRNLSQFGSNSVASLTQRTTVSSDGASLALKRGGTGRLTITGNLGMDRSRYNDAGTLPASSASNNNEKHSYGVAGLYRFSAALQVGTGLRETRGKYPSRVGANTYERSDIDFLFDYTPSAVSTVSGRVSSSRNRDASNAFNGISGLTSQIRWQWQPTGKTRVLTEFSRETGRESSLVLSPDGLSAALDDQSRLSNTLSWRVDHQLTGKVSAFAGLSFKTREIAGTTAINGFDDDINQLLVGLSWAVSRTVSASCDLSHTARKFGGASFDYQAIGCQARITLN